MRRESTDEKLEKINSNSDEVREFLRGHGLSRRLVNLAVRTTVRIKWGKVDEEGEAKTGLLEGTMLANPLYYPNAQAELEVTATQPGKWVAYDHRRPAVFPKASRGEKFKQVFDGKLAAFLIDEVAGNEAEKATTIGTFDMLDFEHFLTIRSYPVGELEELGMVRRRTYAEAYDHVDLYDDFGEELASRRVHDDPVFQVTPKGNTIVVLLPDGGYKRPNFKESKSPSFELEPSLRRA